MGDLELNVAEAIVDRLKAAGTEYFFLLTGGDQPLWIALHEAGIKMIVARSEFSSVYMADGYARASGKPGITYGQAGPGAANVAAALADPFWAQSAVVALTGATATDRMYKGEYQSLDQMPMFSTVTNWNGFAANPEQVPELVSFAINRAITGSRGPAHLDIPKNFFSLDIEYNALGYKESEALSPGLPDTKAVREALKELLSAKKPVILIGEGALISGACNAIAAFAEKLNIPLATTMGGKSCIGWAHPLNLGVVGRYSSKIANDYVGESDCVLVIGSRMGGLATRGYTIPNRKAKVIMINNDPTVFDISYHPSIKLVSDAKRTMEAFLKEIKE